MIFFVCGLAASLYLAFTFTSMGVSAFEITELETEVAQNATSLNICVNVSETLALMHEMILECNIPCDVPESFLIQDKYYWELKVQRQIFECMHSIRADHLDFVRYFNANFSHTCSSYNALFSLFATHPKRQNYHNEWRRVTPHFTNILGPLLVDGGEGTVALSK